MDEQKKTNSLGSRQRKQLNAMESFTLAVKPDLTPKSLEQVLDEMPQAQLQQLQRYASMILKTASPYSGSYYQQAKRMYSALDDSTHLLLAAVLQKISPREDTTGPHEMRMQQLKTKNDYIGEMLKSVQKKQNTLDFRTPKQKQERSSWNTGEKVTDEVNFSKLIDRTLKDLGQIDKHKTNRS